MFRFIQLSGVRWGAAPRLMSPDALSEGLAAELRGDAGRAFAKGCALATEHCVDAVIVTGGLISQPDCTADDLRALFACVSGLAPVPVLVLASEAEVAPGGALHPHTAMALGAGAPPANLIALRVGAAPRVICEHAVVPGVGHFVPEMPAVLMMDGPVPADTADGSWSWIAAGGALEPAVLVDAEGRALGGDPGSLSARELPGPVGSAWLVQLEGACAEFTALPTAPRRGWVLELDVSAVTRPAELVDLARHTLDRVGAQPSDLAWLRLSGSWRVPALPALPADALRGRVAHAFLAPAALTLSPPGGSSTADLHLRALMARPEEGLEAVRLALSAWQGAS